MEESGGIRKGVWGERERGGERVDVERRGEREGKRREEGREGKGERKGRLVRVDVEVRTLGIRLLCDAQRASGIKPMSCGSDNRADGEDWKEQEGRKASGGADAIRDASR